VQENTVMEFFKLNYKGGVFRLGAGGSESGVKSSPRNPSYETS